MRYYKSIGLGFKTPKEAIEGSYVDKKCPFTGNVSIRGRILKVILIIALQWIRVPLPPKMNTLLYTRYTGNCSQ